MEIPLNITITDKILGFISEPTNEILKSAFPSWGIPLFMFGLCLLLGYFSTNSMQRFRWFRIIFFTFVFYGFFRWIGIG